MEKEHSVQPNGTAGLPPAEVVPRAKRRRFRAAYKLRILEEAEACVQLLADLEVNASYSRPYRSNDNPYSEAHFRSAKYHQTYQPRFGSLEDARSWARQFFQWYNHVFYHSGIALMHPATVHYGKAEDVWQSRQRVMDEAFARHPERFIRGAPKVPKPPKKVWINKPAAIETAVAEDGQQPPNTYTHSDQIPAA